jgi:hypothetical protein
MIHTSRSERTSNGLNVVPWTKELVHTGTLEPRYMAEVVAFDQYSVKGYSTMLGVWIAFNMFL